MGKGRQKGFKVTEETKIKISRGRREWLKSHEHPSKGKLVSKETRARIASRVSEHWKTVGHPKGMLGKHHSAETKRKMSLARRGSDHWNWKGGLKALVYGIRASSEYYQWKKAVLERDNHTCQDCGATEGLDTHHIQSLIKYPELIFDVNNGLTLCEDCHKRHTFWQVLRK